LSIGSGGGIDYITITATYVDRYKRQKSIWQIAQALREKIATIPNIRYFDIAPYGSTALASIRASAP